MTASNDRAIDGAALLDDIDWFLEQYVIYPTEHARHSHALWCAHTHLMECWESTPRLYFKSPEPGSGKTRALEVMKHIVANGLLAMDMSSAYLIRRISTNPQPTLLYDEIDTVFGPKAKEHEDIRAVINSGHRQGAIAGRCQMMGTKVAFIDLPSYGAVALAGLGNLPDTITDRAIVVPMKKRTRAERVKPWRIRTSEPQARELGERLAEWADSVRDAAMAYWPEMPPGVEDRNADRWEALLAVADLAGGRWPEAARAAAIADVTDKPAEKESQGVLLLSDIRGIFLAGNHYARNGQPAIKTQVLLKNLAMIPESPWKDIRRGGQQLDAIGLATRLRPYGIKSQDIRWRSETKGAAAMKGEAGGKSSDTVCKGYYRADFEDAWTRYVVPNQIPGGEGTEGGADATP